jgi:transposase
VLLMDFSISSKWNVNAFQATFFEMLSAWSGLEQAIADAVKLASPQMQEVVRGLQALRGIAQISAATIVAELGEFSRFESARQLMLQRRRAQ